MNYYEILEVNENASIETINKIYKIQAKRYHPDLQNSDEEKKFAEEKMKKINDAYSILSDENKRKEYDEKLKVERQRQEYENIKEKIKQNYDDLKEKNNNQNSSNNQVRYTVKKQPIKPQQNVYTKKDYIRDYNKRLRKMKFDIWKKNVLTNIKVILIMILICLFIWFFPPTHRIIIDFYKENVLLQAIIDFAKRIINSFGL